MNENENLEQEMIISLELYFTMRMRNDNTKELFAPVRPDLLSIMPITTYNQITYGPSMATKEYKKKKIRNVFFPSLSLSLSLSLAFLNLARDSQDIFQKITWVTVACR